MEKPTPIKKRNVQAVTPLNAGADKKAAAPDGGIQLTGSIIVGKSPAICYRYWRDFKNLPQFLKHITNVSELDNRRSHWVVTGPADTTVEWDAELTADVPGQQISWHSMENAQVSNEGTVEFKPQKDGQSTQVKVVLTYNPPLGAFGEWISKLFGGNPDDLLAQNLVLFKEAIESGHTDPKYLTTDPTVKP